MSRRGFNHPIKAFALTETVSNQRVLELYYLIRAGNQNARIEMMQAHLRLGLAKVAFFCSSERNATRREEMVSVMLESLWEGIDRLHMGAITHHGDTPNPTAYLMTKLFGNLRAFCFSDRLLPTDPETPYRNSVVGIRNDCKSRNIDPSQHLRCIEIETKACRDERDHQILDMRMSGMDDAEIGTALNLSKARVGQIRASMAERVRKYL